MQTSSAKIVFQDAETAIFAGNIMILDRNRPFPDSIGGWPEKAADTQKNAR